MSFDFEELLASVEDGERSLATIPATVWTGYIPLNSSSDDVELGLARGIAADRDFPAPDSRAPMLVVLTDRRLLVGQAKRTLRSKSGLRRVLGEVSLDRIEAIEPAKVGNGRRSARWYKRLALGCVALLVALAPLENTLPNLVFDVFLSVICLLAFGAFVVGMVAEFVEQSFVVEVSLSNGKSILLQLHSDPDSFLSAFRAVSNQRQAS